MKNEDAVMLTFTLESNTQTKKLWPHDFTLLARFRIAEHCEIELEAWGDYEATAALHSYFQVADIAQVEVSGPGRPPISIRCRTMPSVAQRTVNKPIPIGLIAFIPQRKTAA